MSRIRIFCPSRFVQRGAAFALAFAVGSSAMAQPGSPVYLEYGFQTGQEVAYRVNVKADRDDHEDILSGVISYTAKSVSDDQIQITFHGGLNRSRKNKPGTNTGRAAPFGGPFGPGFRIPPPPSPFDRPTLTGTTQTTNQLTMTPRGEIRSLEGTSQLPYLLGNLSILIFEPLPAEPKNQWTVDAGISITNKPENSGFPFFGPRGLPGSPFDRQEPERRTSASDTTSYVIQHADGSKVVVRKTYSLKSPVTDGRGYEVNGSGTWTFNRTLGIPESLEFQQTFTLRDGQTTMAIPMTVSYQRLTDQEWNAYQQDQQQRQAEAKRRHEEIMEERAAKPLTQQERTRALQDLRSNNTARKMGALQRLKSKKTSQGDREIAAAIAPLQDDSNPLLSKLAREAYEVWNGGSDHQPAGEMSAGDREASEPTNPFVVESDRGIRTWSDDSGKFSVEAEFVEVKDDNVILKRKDGQLLSVPLDRLSDRDKTVVKQLRKR
jgi:hypothetical protein